VDLLHEVQPDELPVNGLSTPLMPKSESFLLTLREPQLGQSTSWEPNMSFSKSSPHSSHLYSNIGIIDYNTQNATPQNDGGLDNNVYILENILHEK
jgi:hypothetical protein